MPSGPGCLTHSFRPGTSLGQRATPSTVLVPLIPGTLMCVEMAQFSGATPTLAVRVASTTGSENSLSSCLLEKMTTMVVLTQARQRIVLCILWLPGRAEKGHDGPEGEADAPPVS